MNPTTWFSLEVQDKTQKNINPENFSKVPRQSLASLSNSSKSIVSKHFYEASRYADISVCYFVKDIFQIFTLFFFIHSIK